jgi:hypothetical protein
MKPWEAAGGEMQDPFVEVAAFADLGKAPYIEIVAQVGERDREQYWRMTPEEARTLAARLVEIADTIDG